jgi:hypothetical protein
VFLLQIIRKNSGENPKKINECPPLQGFKNYNLQSKSNFKIKNNPSIIFQKMQLMKTKLFALMILFALPLFSNAQQINDEIKLIQSAFGMEKRALLEQYMELPADSGFWPIYETYETERRALMKERILIINEYLEKLPTLTEADADKIALKAMKNTASLSGVASKHYKKVKGAIGAINAAKFVQFENYIQSTVLLAISESLPFIGEL